MMRHEFKKYDKYKDSGVEWIGKVPFNWISGRIKDFADINVSTRIPTNLTNDDLVEFVPMTNVNNNIGRIEKFNFVPLKAVSSGYTKFKNRDVIFAKITPCMENGNCVIVNGLSHDIGFGSTEFMVFRSFRKLTEEYLHYFLHNDLFRQNAEPFMKGTAGQKRISSQYMTTHYLALPPISEQKTITNYLDTKTTQIDKKIYLLTKKVDQYSELKQSLINETVTHGLDKTVAMKDSGVEWIGKIPEHWEKKRVKDLFVESKIKSVTGQETLLSVSEYSGVTQKKDNVGNDELLTNAITLVGYKICKAGELIINIMLAWKRGLGVSSFDGIVSPSYAVYSPNKSICSAYFHYLFRSNRAIVEFKRNSTGIIESRLRLYSDNFYSIDVVIPEYKEQKAIANYLDTKTAQIDRIVETINTEIEKLKELRKTLINDVVTGKIKVITEGE
ncbi:type I restriction enzyme S subunit [Clostridium algifaecis]|uniref:Type I restriction enzyme S subunit n=1 Tax=Clostridium algifaecis TaxID=1472040 RepID=A0ABS4KRP6_9CLOT|nr:restriction endonuclease subunit S [Clostridium algifaecis]MBP2032699.1 type I restriction enzyme S subunit [Clostridium algifaecis]